MKSSKFDKIFWKSCFTIVLLLCLMEIAAIGSNLYMKEGTSIAAIIGSDLFFEVIEPEEIAFTYKIRPAKDFGVPFNNTLYEVPLVPVDPPCGCGMPHNAEDLEGSVAFVERGECSFMSKSVRAQQVGARAIIISDHDPDSDEFYIEMIDDNTNRDVNIPAGFLLGKNGHIIRNTLEKLNRKHALINLPVNLTNVPLHKMNQPPWLGW